MRDYAIHWRGAEPASGLFRHRENVIKGSRKRSRKVKRTGGYAMKVAVEFMKRPVVIGSMVMCVSVLALFIAHADPIPKGWQASNMKEVG